MPKAKFSDQFVCIDELGFFGSFRTSPSGEWCICWSDSDHEFNSGRGGYRTSGKGLYLLYNKSQDKVYSKGMLARPSSAHVANNGVFCVEDWGFGAELRSSIHVFSSNGSYLFEKNFSANIFNSGISENGLYIVCQTANNPNSSDGNIFTAFDILAQQQIFSVCPITGWAEGYDFDELNKKIGVVVRGMGTYCYDMRGNFIDLDKYEKDQLNSNRYEVVLLKAQQILKDSELDRTTAEIIINASDRGLSLLPKDEFHYSSWAAMAYKSKGLAYEFLDQKQLALDSFDEALRLDPKIGIKRKADKLRKKLAK